MLEGSLRVMLVSESKIDANESALSNLLSLVLSLANKLSESDTFVKHGLTIPEWALLNEIPADGSEIALKKLAVLVGLSPQRAKVFIAKLEGRGIIQGSTPPEPRGAKRYVITSAGISLKSAAEKALCDMQVAMLNPSQVRGLARSVRIVRRLSKMVNQNQSSS
jgi:DNA-binding MarR family transcriptional regulator